MTTSPIWTARAKVSSTQRAWNASRTPVGSAEHAAYMAAKRELEAVKQAASPAPKVVAVAPAPLVCCGLAKVVNRRCVCAGISMCPSHGEIHHGTHD